MNNTSESIIEDSQDASLVPCHLCKKLFKRRGLNLHLRKSHPENNTNHQVQQQPPTDAPPTQNTNNPLDAIFTHGFGAKIVNNEGGQDTIWRLRWKKSIKLSGNQYNLPQGNIGRHFIDLLATEITDLVNELPKNGFSERIFIYCSSILQRDSLITKGSDIRRLINRRLEMWRTGQFDELLQEAERCNKKISRYKKQQDSEHMSRVFNRLMLQGKIRQANRFITERNGGGTLNPNDQIGNKSVFQILEEKHPNQAPPIVSDFDQTTVLPHLVNVDITSSHIEKVARSISGGAGPSGTDADQWKTMLLRFGPHSFKLRESIAALTRKLANEIVEWDAIRALLARRGIALDKCPGVRPIGIGEVLQRITAKAMVMATGIDVQQACGANQLCSGMKAGIEGATHAISQVFEEDDAEGVLLVDANNAFNALNRPLALWNCRLLWPRCSRFLFNTYRGHAVISLRNTSQYILSKEGTTQGDPLAMLMYAIGILPLIKLCKNKNNYIQNWYADDSACVGKLDKILEWFKKLTKEGPRYGYFPEPTKSYLIIKEGLKDIAEQKFSSLGIKIVNSQRFLGGFIGDTIKKSEYITNKIKKWIECIKKMSRASEKYPQTVHAAFTKSLQYEWQYLQRVTDGTEDTYSNLKNAIMTHLTPSIMSREVTTIEHQLYALPARLGGLAINDPTKQAKTAYETSLNANRLLIDAIRTGEEINIGDHQNHTHEILKEERKKRTNHDQQELETILEQLTAKTRKSIKRTIEKKSSQWLTVLPTKADDTDLTATQFRDGLAIRYGHEPTGLPLTCDGCGENNFNLNHALNCKKGGLIKKGHDQHRDDIKNWAELAWGSGTTEPIMRASSSDQPALVGDLLLEGVWEPARKAFFDIRIVNADAASYSPLTWPNIAQIHAREKHRKYDLAAEDLRASFTPLVVSCDGIVGTEYESFIKKTSLKLHEKWSKPFSQIISWLKTKTQISIIRAVSMRIRGTRKRIARYSNEDGCGIPTTYEYDQ